MKECQEITWKLGWLGEKKGEMRAGSTVLQRTVYDKAKKILCVTSAGQPDAQRELFFSEQLGPVLTPPHAMKRSGICCPLTLSQIGSKLGNGG